MSRKKKNTWALGYTRMGKYGRFLDLSIAENWNRLTEKEKMYYRKYAEVYNVDFQAETTEYYRSLPVGMRSALRGRQQYILSGGAYRHMHEVAHDNYIKGLYFNGKIEIGDTFDTLWSYLTVDEQARLMERLPRLFMFYKNVGRNSHRSGNLSAFSEGEMEEQVEQVKQVLVDFYLDEDIDIASRIMEDSDNEDVQDMVIELSEWEQEFYPPDKRRK